MWPRRVGAIRHSGARGKYPGDGAKQLRVFVFGVIVAPPDTDEFIKAAVLGDGDGNETGPSIRGLRPVPGMKR
jgi:hypothetical protein